MTLNQKEEQSAFEINEAQEAGGGYVPASPLANVSATRQVLDEAGLSAKYRFGQNFLVNDAIIQKIISLSEVAPVDSVLEVGPGIGTLTVALLAKGAQVSAVEIDSDMCEVLPRTVAEFANPASFYLIHKDALELSAADLPSSSPLPNKLIANLPYQVAATVVLDYFERFPSLNSQTIMVQKEVADRMRAKVGTKLYGAYSVKLSLYAEATGSFIVGPKNFFPPPRVDSTVIRLDRVKRPESNETLKAAALMADAAFFQRRKTISNSMKAFFANRGMKEFTQETIKDMLLSCNIDERTRGEKLTTNDYLKLGTWFIINR